MTLDSNTVIGLLMLIFWVTLVTVATRWGGIFIMGYIPLNPKVKRFIFGMSSAVLLAIVAPYLVKGDISAIFALGVTAVSVLTLKKPMLAVAMGIIACAVFRHTLG